MTPHAIRNYARLGSQLLAVSTIYRQLRSASHDHDGLRLVDAAANALAILTTVLLIVREIRSRDDDAAALREAPL